MNRLKFYIPSFITSVLLVFSITGITVISMVSNCLLSPKFYTKSAQENGVYESVRSYAEDYFEKSYNVSGIPAEIYMEGLDEAIIKNAVDGKVTAFLKYAKDETSEIEAVSIDFSKLEQNLTDFFDEFAVENNVEINDEFNKQLDNTIKTAESEIQTFTDVYMLEYMAKANIPQKLREITPLISIGIYALIGLAAICVILLAALNKKKISNALYWIASSGLCASVLMLVPCVMLSSSDYFKRLVLRTDYVYSAVTGLLNDSLALLINTQIAVLIVSIILMAAFAAASVIRNKKNKDA